MDIIERTGNHTPPPRTINGWASTLRLVRVAVKRRTHPSLLRSTGDSDATLFPAQTVKTLPIIIYTIDTHDHIIRLCFYSLVVFIAALQTGRVVTTRAMHRSSNTTVNVRAGARRAHKNSRLVWQRLLTSLRIYVRIRRSIYLSIAAPGNVRWLFDTQRKYKYYKLVRRACAHYYQ